MACMHRGDTISGRTKVLHALQPHHDFCSFFALCKELLAILADATHTSFAVAFFSCIFYRQSERADNE
eukprot:scaffold249657_cov54-Attheya_sp.AAC.1